MPAEDDRGGRHACEIAPAIFSPASTDSYLPIPEIATLIPAAQETCKPLRGGKSYVSHRFLVPVTLGTFPVLSHSTTYQDVRLLGSCRSDAWARDEHSYLGRRDFVFRPSYDEACGANVVRSNECMHVVRAWFSRPCGGTAASHARCVCYISGKLRPRGGTLAMESSTYRADPSPCLDVSRAWGLTTRNSWEATVSGGHLQKLTLTLDRFKNKTA